MEDLKKLTGKVVQNSTVQMFKKLEAKRVESACSVNINLKHLLK